MPRATNGPFFVCFPDFFPPTSHLCGFCLQWLSWQMKFWLLIKLKITDILWQWSLSPSYITSNSDCALRSLISYLQAQRHKDSSWPMLRWEGGSQWVSPLAYQERRGGEFKCVTIKAWNHHCAHASTEETSTLTCPALAWQRLVCLLGHTS